MDDLTKTATVGRAALESSRKRSRRAAPVALLLIVLGAAAIAGADWWLGRGQVSTDDAFIDGRAITLAPQVAGTVVKLLVADNQRVKAGDLILEIDAHPYQVQRDKAEAQLGTAEAALQNARAHRDIIAAEAPARLQAAKAQLAASEAALARAEADWLRQSRMPAAATTRQEIDAANAARLSAEANVAAARANVSSANTVAQQLQEADSSLRELAAKVAFARAQLDQAQLNLSWTRLTAPADGWITKRNVEVGNYLQPGQSLMALVLPDIWVTANFKENDLQELRPGQMGDISVDAYPDLHLRGHVDSVQLGTGARFTAFPPENATGNFVKIVQRVPVKLVIDSGLDPNRPLPLGASVVPTVHTR
jgi:membrane fusion protein (multidrug efflux system)